MADQRQLWPLAIDWKRGLTQSVEYKTEIFTSRDRHEFRRAARETPRFNYEYTGWAHGSEAQAVLRVSETLIGETLIFANPVFRAVLETPLVAPTRTFSVASVPEWLTEGAYIVFEGQDLRFLARVEFIDGNDVTIDDDALATFPAGAKFVLGIQCRIDSSMQISYLTNEVLSAKVTLEDVTGLNYVPDEGDPYDLYNGKEVLLKKPNWAQAIAVNLQAGIDVVDVGFGRVSYEDYLDYVPSILKAEYLGKTWEESIDFLQFFLRQRARRGEFYLPSPLSDLPISADLVSGSSVLRVSGSEYSDYASNPARRNLVIVQKNGTKLFRKVSAIAVDGEESVLTLTTPWASAIARSQISYVGWLSTYRFAVDELAIEWLTDSVAQFSTSFQLLRDLDESL